MTLLEVSGLCKRFPDGTHELAVLDGVSFEIDDGDFTGLWGMRRSGKSTLMRILAGIEPPDSGSMALDGVELTALTPDSRARLMRGVVGLASFGWPTHHRNRIAREHVALAACADRGVTGRRARVLASRALHRVGALDCAEHPLERLSLGEQIRVEIARAAVREPRLLLIDDPPALQSPSENAELLDLLSSLGSEPDRAVLLAACDTAPIQGAKRMMALGHGRLRTMEQAGTVVQFPTRTGTRAP